MVMKTPAGKRSLQAGPVAARPMPGGSVVTVSITRKYSVAPYETADIFISATSEVEPGETQEAATARLYDQAKKDAAKMGQEVRLLAKGGTL